MIGLARSGVAAAEFLVRHGAAVVATDRKLEAELPAEALALRSLGVRLELGPHRAETFTSASLVVVSPGVPWELPQLEAARRAGVPVIAEIELAYRHLQGRVAAVTGTKGKTTTTAALGAMLAAAGLDARVGGNIGTPLVGLVEGSTPATVFAVEVSSFQLEGIVRFHPQLAIWLNLSPDHLDRHPSLRRLRRGQGAGLPEPDGRGLGGRERGRRDRAPGRAPSPLAQAGRTDDGRASPGGGRGVLRGGRRAPAARRHARRRSSAGTRSCCPAATSPATCSSPPRPRACSARRRRRSRARCVPSAASSTCSSTSRRSTVSPTTTTPRPRTSRRRAAASTPSSRP